MDSEQVTNRAEILTAVDQAIGCLLRLRARIAAEPPDWSLLHRGSRHAHVASWPWSLAGWLLAAIPLVLLLFLRACA